MEGEIRKVKIIGIYKVWPDTTRGNLANIKHRRFGQRSFIHRCQTDAELVDKIKQLKKHGYTSI